MAEVEAVVAAAGARARVPGHGGQSHLPVVDARALLVVVAAEEEEVDQLLNMAKHAKQTLAGDSL